MLSKKKQKKLIRGAEYAQFQTLRILSFVIYFFLASIVIITLWFLYTRMYQAIGQVETISALTPVASVQAINIEGYNNVQSLLEVRSTDTIPALARDPFNDPSLFPSQIKDDTVVTSTVQTTSTIEVME